MWINSSVKYKIARSHSIHYSPVSKDIGELFKYDFPYPLLLPTEFNTLRIKWTCLSHYDRPDTLEAAEAVEDLFTIYID